MQNILFFIHASIFRGFLFFTKTVEAFDRQTADQKDQPVEDRNDQKHHKSVSKAFRHVRGKPEEQQKSRAENEIVQQQASRPRKLCAFSHKLSPRQRKCKGKQKQNVQHADPNVFDPALEEYADSQQNERKYGIIYTGSR